ncbi:MAG: hypothetical protein GTO55_11640 [Armatimonadetes bacterium]|nr:hypothetical protein [Armatimonadota bacterium]NIM24868.1 hypothetical protein [Armatimonadota bacterium]NIM68758.1 hypothetical protein [Armatimonadota bacterium]NIM77019.1 hypothetical protein [Armatimonadota bacterium]NIN06954.1 hypothetical protein [Armatimonadota bacterium]
MEKPFTESADSPTQSEVHNALQHSKNLIIPRSTILLTNCEMKVARLVAQGKTNAEIAEELFLSLSTIKSHIRNALARLGIRNRVELALWVTEHSPLRHNIC